MDDKFKKDYKNLFAESFFETVFPEIDKLIKRIDELEEKVVKRNDDVFTKMDAVYKEVIDMRTEQIAHLGSHLRIDETIEDHETRLKVFETKRTIDR